jgi:DNA-binding NtrC family response regulator
MRSVFETISAVGQNRSNVLIQGETGTGKELVAKAIHYSGPRRDGPFIALNCGSVSKTLLESQLFGHVKGAFTGAVKDNPGYFVATEGGTLFLDEITEVDTEIQVRLLRAIQEREVPPVGGTKPVPFDVRIIAATNRNAQEAVEEDALRQDLFYRLSVVVIDLPPLRDRREDVRALVDYFNSRLSAEYGIAPREVSGETMQLLQEYDWPGNVRQLENVIERAFALGHGPAIGPENLPPEIRRDSRPAAPADGAPPASCTLEEGERAIILRALEEAGGNKVKAARILGIKRKRLYRLLHKHGLMLG